MRVQIVLNGLGTGGAERSTAELLPALQTEGIEARVACLYHRAEGVEQQVRSGGTPVTVLRGTWFQKAAQLRRSIRGWHPDVVHTAIFEADLVGRLAAVGGPPVLTSLVNVAYDPTRLADPSTRRWKLEAARLIESASARSLTSHFHAISDEVKRSAVERLGIRPADITVVPRGRSRDRLGRRSDARRAAVRSAMGVNDDRPVVLSVGRQEYQKGQRHLIRAFDRAIDRHPDALLWIAGREGVVSRDLRAVVASSAASDQVRFLGHRTDVTDLLCAADVFAFPSLYEGLGGAVLEAMALECPIVASDLPPLREYLTDGQTALLVPPGDEAALAAGISHVLGDPEFCSELTRHAVDVFSRRFEVAEANRRMIDLYRTVGRRGHVAEPEVRNVGH